jgi:hypothetical protein
MRRTFLWEILLASSQFLAKALAQGGVSGQFRPDKLQGDGAIQFPVVSAIDRPHPPFAEQNFHLVAWAKIYGPGLAGS